LIQRSRNLALSMIPRTGTGGGGRSVGTASGLALFGGVSRFAGFAVLYPNRQTGPDRQWKINLDGL
jgi:hypothetical protein